MLASGGLPRRVRIGVRALAIVMVGLVPGLASGTTGSPAPGAPAPAGGCGRTWSRPELIGTLPKKLLEVSGFVASARYPGVGWMIRDSASPHSLYSFKLGAGGPEWSEFPVSKVSNYDWEDLAYSVGADGRGRLWIWENGSETGPKQIFEVIEPDPGSPGPVQVANRYRVEYRGGNRNTETLFSLGGRLAVVTKAAHNRVYRLPWPMSTSRTNYLEDAGHLDVDTFMATLAVSSDERTLATVDTEDRVVAFEAPDGDGDLDAFMGPDPVFHANMVKSQREAGDFFPYDSCDLVFVSEDATVWRLSNPRSLRPYQAPDTPPPVDPPPPGVPEPPAAEIPSPEPSRPAQAEAGSGVGYWMAGADGSVHAFGAATDFGAPAAVLGPAAAVDIEPTPMGDGYWVVDQLGTVHAFGTARHLGDLSTAALAPGEEVASLSATPSGDGYWLFTTTGRVVAFGTAVHHGDLSAVALNGRVLDSVATPTGGGYYLVAADGGIFAFGDARYLGSMGGRPLNAPVQSLVPDPDGAGYWLVASDGGVFAFDAPFRGSMGGQALNRPVTGMVAYGDGYLMVGEDGGIFNFSDRAFLGSLGSAPPDGPIVSVAALG